MDRLTGERRSVQSFVAGLGASSSTYAQATWTQGLAKWISGHVAFEAIGGVPALLVPGNTNDQGRPLRSADQRQLRRYGGALRHGHSAGEAATATGQGEGRTGGPHG
jgi:transposase